MGKKGKKRVSNSFIKKRMKGATLYNVANDLNVSLAKINKNIAAVQQYDALAYQLRQTLGVIDKPTMNFQGDEMKLDIDEFAKSTYKEQNKYQVIARLKDIERKASKAYDMLQSHSQGQIVNTVYIDMLLQARSSEKYKAMSNSAGKSSSVTGEDDFWERTVKKALREGQITNKRQFLNQLNTKMVQAGYPPFAKWEIRNILNEVSGM